MRKRLTAALLCLCLLFTLLPATAFAEGEADSGPPPAQSALCEHHPQHDESCGYTEGTAGTPCTFVCKVCNAQDSGNAEDSSGAQPEECTCETLCTEEEVNGDCPVCSAEGAELDKACIGAAPMLAAAAPLSSEHSGHEGWTELLGTINDISLPNGNYVLTGDVTLGKGLYHCESVTICLNGHKIDGNTEWLRNVTICDCTGNGTMYDFTSMDNISLSNVKLRDCEITGSATIDGNTTIYAGCTIEAGADESITINSNTTITSGVEIGVGGSGILSLNGANVQSAIDVRSGTCNITGGTISSPILVRLFGTCNITGGTISSSIEVSGGTCNITDGTIKVYDYTSSGEITGAVVVKNGICNIGGDAQITGNRIGNGGAVSVLGGNCTISGSNIYNNNTKYGGVYVENGTCTIEEDASITSNQAFDQGGGVYVAGGICNIYGTIGSNYTAHNHEGDGGGVYVAGGECNIYGKIYNNTAKRDGGGVYVAGGKCDIAATLINYNDAAGNGGGIYVAGGECRIATQTIGLNTATGNGGGVYVASGAKVTVNNTQAGPPRITHNTANGNGGGVYLCEGVEWNNLCYVTTNTAQYGGGIYSEGDCKLTIRNGSVEGNTATVEGGGLYLKDSQTKPCIVEITNWTIKDNKDNSSRPNNMVSHNSRITYEQGLSTQDTLPYEEPGSIILKDSASFTIMSGKYKASEISSCFTRQSDNKILIAGGYYDADPSKEPTLTVVDGVKAIELDGDIGYNQYDPNYPWAVYPVKDGIMSGTSNNPVYNGAPIEQDSGFSLSGATDIQKFYYWHKSQGAEDSTYISGLPSDAGDYTIKVGGLHLRTIGKEYYTECTFDLTIAKADPSYTVPAGITAQVGKPLSTVTLPEGWAWKNGSTIPQTEGTQTYPAILTPDDTANYNTVETSISVEVVKEPVVQEYAITFDANGGSVSPSSAQTKNGKLESLPTPTRGGYDFLGWYTEETGGEKVTTDTFFTENSTIYAHWQNIPVIGVKLDKTSLTMQETGSDTLTATVEPDNATNKNVNWESSDTSIATVDASGKVTAISAGTATITATADGKSATCTVTVTAKPSPDRPVITRPSSSRISGDDRFETAMETADQLKKELGVTEFSAIVVACSDDFADALSASAFAHEKEAPVLVVNENNEERVKAYIEQNLAKDGTVYIMGGSAAVTGGFEDSLSDFDTVRFAGDDRYETNLNTLKELNLTGKEDIIIASGKDFSDALSASSTGCPIMIVGERLTEPQIAFLKTLGGDDTYYIAGGTAAVSKEVEEQLRALNAGSVKRLAGEDRYETSMLIAETFYGRTGSVYIASGEDFPDGLTGGVLAGLTGDGKGAPLILVNRNNTERAAEYIDDVNPRTVKAIGGKAAVPDDVLKAVI